MAKNGAESVAAMGVDSPIPVLSKMHQPLFNYFKQLFAQVTNPPIDAIREERETQKESQISLLDARIEELKAELDSLDDDASDRLKERAKVEAELAKWQNDNSVYGKKKIKELNVEVKINTSATEIVTENNKIKGVFYK